MTDILDVLEDEEFEPDAITLDDGESVVEAHDETLEVPVFQMEVRRQQRCIS